MKYQLSEFPLSKTFLKISKVKRYLDEEEARRLNLKQEIEIKFNNKKYI